MGGVQGLLGRQGAAGEAKVVCSKEEAETQVIMDEAGVIKDACQVRPPPY